MCAGALLLAPQAVLSFTNQQKPAAMAAASAPNVTNSRLRLKRGSQSG